MLRSSMDDERKKSSDPNPNPPATSFTSNLKGFKKFQAQLERKKLEKVPRRELGGKHELDAPSSYIVGINTNPQRKQQQQQLPNSIGSPPSSCFGVVGAGVGGEGALMGVVGEEEWVLHTSGMDLRECCCQPDSISSSGLDSNTSASSQKNSGGWGVSPPPTSTIPVSVAGAICPPPPPRESREGTEANLWLHHPNEEEQQQRYSGATVPSVHITHLLRQSQQQQQPPRPQKNEQFLLQPKQWETELDLILPVGEGGSGWPRQLQGKIHGESGGLRMTRQEQEHLSKYSGCSGGGGGHQRPIDSTGLLMEGGNMLRSDSVSASITPESRTGSFIKISENNTTNHTAAARKRFPCPRFGLDIRQLCLVCGVVMVGAAVCLAIGVPIALEMRSQQKGDFRQSVVRKLLSEVPLIDGHNDLAWNLRKFLQNQIRDLSFDSDLRLQEPFGGSQWSHTDLIRLREGGVGAQLEKAHGDRKIASLIGVEGGHAIGNSLAVLRMLYALGARFLTLTHNCNTPWADAAMSEYFFPERGGLTEFGKLVVLEMNRLGMLVDLAHVSVPTMKDALKMTRAPVIFSHSSAYSLCNHSRNVPDDVLKLVAANGGIVMVPFYNVFLTCNESATMQDVIAHIQHIRDVAGVDHVGIGAGFDGINLVPTGLEDVSSYPKLLEELLRNETWTERDLKKLIGINFLRVFRQVEAVRDGFKSSSPIEEWVPKSDLQESGAVFVMRSLSEVDD